MPTSQFWIIVRIFVGILLIGAALYGILVMDAETCKIECHPQPAPSIMKGG